MVEQAQESRKYKDWLANLEKNGCTLESSELIYTRHHEGQALFALLMTKVRTPEGNYIPPILFLKGTVLSVLICLIDQDTKEKYLLVVRQRRICDGSFMLEHTAGMVDGYAKPEDIALKEVEEETGLKISLGQLTCHTPEPLYPSTGTSDEAMLLFSCTLELSFDEIMAYNNQSTGVASEHEAITTAVLPFKIAHSQMTNPSALLLNFLYLQKKASLDLLS